MSKEFLIFGAGGHARDVLDVILDNDPAADLIFVDPAAESGEVIETKVPGRTFEVLPEIQTTEGRECFIALGDNQKRQEVRQSLGDIALAKVIAKDARIGIDAQIESGCFIGHQAIIGPFARIGEGVIVNTRSLVSHEVEVGAYSQLTLDVTVGGRTKIGEDVFIGMKTGIFDRINICSAAIIGANSLVTSDINEPGTYMGTPARRVR